MIIKKFNSPIEAVRYIAWYTVLAVCWIITGCSIISKLCNDHATEYQSTKGMIVPLIKEWDAIAALGLVTLFLGFLPALLRKARTGFKNHPRAKYGALGFVAILGSLGYWQLYWIPTQLETACRKGDLPQLTRVLRWGGSPHHYPFQTRTRTPINEAIFFNQPGIVAELMNRGVKDTPDNPLLHYAIRCDITNPQLIQVLLDHGCDPKIKNSDGLTALEHAEKKGQTSTIEILRRAQTTSTTPKA